MIKKFLKIIKIFIIGLARKYIFHVHPKLIEAVYYSSVMKFRPDIIQCHEWPTFELGVRVKEEINAYLVVDCHELEAHRSPPLPEHKRKWMELYEARVLPQADLITTVSPGIAFYLEKKYQIRRPKLVFNAPMASERPSFKSTIQRWGRRSTLGGVRQELNLTDSEVLIVMIGNITRNRGFEIAARAVALLSTNVHLACIGRISDEFKEVYYNEISRLNLIDRVHHIKPVNPVDVVDFIRSADIAIVPIIPETLSYELALPNKLFEAAFANLPIVASNTFEVSKVVSQYNLGVIYEADSPEECASAIDHLLNLWNGPGSLIRNNENFRKVYSFEHCIDLFSKVL